MDFSVIIPVYNGEKTIPELYRRLKEELEDNYTYEIIFVHDHGKDKSWSVITDLIQNNPSKVKGFNLSRNYGQHSAILFGINEARGDFIITLDEDLQHNPSLISKLVEKQNEDNFDVVYVEFKKLKHSGIRIKTSDLLRGFLRNIVPGLFPGYSPYRLIKRDVAKKITFLKSSYTFIDGYLGMVTDDFGFISADHFKRADGVSSYSYYKLLKHAILIAVAYSPLKRWILTSALIFNSLSIIVFLISGVTQNSAQVKLGWIFTGIMGIILLLTGLIAEAIHYKGMKTNSIPHSISEI